MRRHAKTTLVVLAALFGAACWAFRSSGNGLPPTTEQLDPGEKAAAVGFVERAVAAAHEGSRYAGRRNFLKLAAEPRRRVTNDETFELLRGVSIAPDAQWEAVRMKQDGEIGVLFRDDRGVRVSVMLRKNGGDFKVARAGTI